MCSKEKEEKKASICILFVYFYASIMERPAFLLTIFLACILVSITGYALYVGFGPPSEDLRDPFEEHED